MPVLRPAVRHAMAKAFGPVAFDPEKHPGDLGLTGPGSPSWRVLADPAAIAGGVRGLLLQLMHPIVVAGFFHHSSFRDGPIRRLQHTAAYITVSTFGAAQEASEVARRVRAMHRSVVGISPEGRPYRADEPQYLAWVSVALTSSILETHRLWSPDRLTSMEEDRFVLEQSRIAALLDPSVDLSSLASSSAQERFRGGELDDRLPLLREGLLPANVELMGGVLKGFESELAVGELAREALSFLRTAPLPAVLYPGYWSLLSGAIASLPASQQRMLGAELSELGGKALRGQTGALLNFLRVVAGSSPSALAAHARVSAVGASSSALHYG